MRCSPSIVQLVHPSLLPGNTLAWKREAGPVMVRMPDVELIRGEMEKDGSCTWTRIQ